MKVKTVKVSDKGQIAIPKEMRNILHIEKGDEVLLIAEGNIIIIEKVKKENFRDILKLSESTAQKIWDNDEDDVWNEL
ncbi:MAG: AbrB/MazE/SpoVT family DNA-binding domain-containing protein [Candidatus Heimdallarchaeota archaeon]|nr:AbrB/MazE/SpoVT family DNA-binding domain-containing protein [Candidatus Heimdallarchaeota archaeon]